MNLINKIKLLNLQFLIICFTILITSSIACDISSEDVKEKWYYYEPIVVELSGRLEMMTGYGPPNYGENPEKDKKINYYVLTLDNPINVKGNSTDEINQNTYTNVNKIQLVYHDSINILKDHINQKVIIGTLFEAITGAHYTDILIEVKDLKEKL